MKERAKQKGVDKLQGFVNEYALAQTLEKELDIISQLVSYCMPREEHRDWIIGRWRPKLLIIGYGRHGKDTVCEILKQRLGFTFSSSSWFVAERAVFPLMTEYETVEDCYNDRHNRRQEWFEAIREFNRLDGARLAREITEKHDIYCGMRSIEEFDACKKAKLFDAVIWVDRSHHLPSESSSSMTITKNMADIVIDNNGTIEDLEKNVLTVASMIFGSYMVSELTKYYARNNEQSSA